MDLFDRPLEFVDRMFGTRNHTLIYGDLDFNRIVFSSNTSLVGYSEGKKYVPLDDPDLKEFDLNYNMMTESPEPIHTRLLGVKDRFGYVGSMSLLSIQEPEVYKKMAKANPYSFREPPMSGLTHEATHLATRLYVDIWFPFLSRIKRMGITNAGPILDEAIAVYAEALFTKENFPDQWEDFEEEYMNHAHSSTDAKNEWHLVTKEASMLEDLAAEIRSAAHIDMFKSACKIE